MVTFNSPNHPMKNFKSTGRSGSWYEMKNVSSEMTELFIYDEIGAYGVEASAFIQDLQNTTSKVLNIRISSRGGAVFEGLNILNALRQHPAQKIVTIDGAALSAASFIAMAGDIIRMSPQAVMMIHDAQFIVEGNASDMRETADLLDKMSNNIADIYAERTGKPADEWRKLMRAETWFTDKEAVEAGLADEIVPSKARVSNRATNKAPEGDTDPGNEKEIETISLKPETEEAKIENAIDTSDWNANKAWSNGAASDNPEAFYKAICAGEKTAGDPSTQAHWALPYRYTPDSPPNASAVRNALARLSQTHELKNPDETRAKLEKILKTINADDKSVSNNIDPRLLAVALLDALKGVNNG